MPYGYVDRKLWLEWRERAYSEFKRDIDIGYVDEDIVELIELIFRTEHYFTISSCSGRVVAVDAEYPWLRTEGVVLFKKHSPISMAEFTRLVSTPVLSRLWLVVSGPILHIVADGIDQAYELLRNVRSLGFKHSGIISLRNDGVVLEVISGIWLPILIKERNVIMLNEQSFSSVVELVNKTLIAAKKRLQRLKDLFSEESMKRSCKV
ncbi:MAG: hypothetical protein DRO12_00465 [Thermoprotei archaeon]|nr:MAG: hypothetical protein DRO12_00465 [Thermoprotei archaeon]